MLVWFAEDLAMNSGITSWVEQGRDEINKLVEQYADDRRVILLGSFSVGPTAIHPGHIQPFFTALIMTIFI